jgi:hypothetical protein
MPRKKVTEGSIHEVIATVAGISPSFRRVAELAGVGLAVTSLLGELGYVKARVREKPKTKAAKPDKKQAALPLNGPATGVEV